MKVDAGKVEAEGMVAFGLGDMITDMTEVNEMNEEIEELLAIDEMDADENCALPKDLKTDTAVLRSLFVKGASGITSKIQTSRDELAQEFEGTVQFLEQTLGKDAKPVELDGLCQAPLLILLVSFNC